MIPWGRTLDAATVLAPGAIGNGPGGNIMISGALSYDNLNLVNGVNVNENLRQQAAAALRRGRRSRRPRSRPATSRPSTGASRAAWST